MTTNKEKLKLDLDKVNGQVTALQAKLSSLQLPSNVPLDWLSVYMHYLKATQGFDSELYKAKLAKQTKEYSAELTGLQNQQRSYENTLYAAEYPDRLLKAKVVFQDSNLQALKIDGEGLTLTCSRCSEVFKEVPNPSYPWISILDQEYIKVEFRCPKCNAKIPVTAIKKQ
ncbi:MAG: hypothetical protein ABSD42_04455 [Candidatus Bathyarchaeia archaeon]|jgi:uncharacterized C2H2 Zn-finger protein